MTTTSPGFNFKLGGLPKTGARPCLDVKSSAFAMNESIGGRTFVKSGSQGQTQVGVPVDFQRAKLDRGHPWRRQEQPEQPLKQSTQSVGILAAMNQDDEFPGW